MAQFYDSRFIIEDTLPAAGATFTTDPVAINTYADVTPLLVYIRGGAGGAINIQIQVSPDNSPGSYYAIGGIQSAAIVAGTDVLLSTQRSSITYTSTGAGQEAVTLPTFTVVGQWVRFVIRESGVPVTPGMCRLTVFLRGNQ